MMRKKSFLERRGSVWLACLLMAGTLSAQPVYLAAPAPPEAPMPPPPPDVQVLITGGSFLGVNVREIDSERAKELKLKEVHGVEITGVEEESPAEKAGLKKGDVVQDYQGQRVEGTQQFIRLVRETPAGREVKMTVIRNGAAQAVTAAIGSRKAKLQRQSYSFSSPRFDVWIPDIPRAFTSWRSPMLGVEGESVEGQLATHFGVKEGVLVRSVVKGSAAEKAGIKAGDVILRVEKEEVKSPRELSSAIRSHRSKNTLAMSLMRERKETSVQVTLEDEAERPGSRAIVRQDEFE